MQVLRPDVTRIGFNDDVPELDKNGVRIVFQATEDTWHHTADIVVVIDEDDSATLAEYKQRALQQAECVLEQMFAGLADQDC